MKRESDPDPTERDLARRLLLRGDEEAFRALYRRHAPALYSLLLRLLGGRQPEAQDVLQEVWIRAVEKLPSFGWRSSLRTWLCGIAVNCTRELERQERRFSTKRLDEVAEPTAPAASGAQAGHLDFERAVRQLPAGYRQVLVLCDIEGYTHGEVAGLLGIAPGTSKSQLSRARQALRQLVQTT